MPLDFQLTQAPFRFGIDEGQDPKQVPLGTLLTAENVVWLKAGRLQKRFGSTTLPASIVGGGSITSGSRLFLRNDELCLISAGKVYSFSSLGWKLAAGTGQIAEVGLTWETLQDGVSGVTASCVGYVGGTIVHAWAAGDPTLLYPGSVAQQKVYYQLIDRDDDSKTTPPMLLGSGEQATVIRVLISGTDWIVLWNTSGGSIRCSVNGAAAVSLRIDGAVNAGAGPDGASARGPSFDASVSSAGFTIVYALAAGDLAVYSYTIASVPVQVATGTVVNTGSTDIWAVSIDSVELLWVGWVEGGIIPTAYYATADEGTLLPILAPTAVEGFAGMWDATIAVKRVDATHALYAISMTNTGTGVFNEGVTRTRLLDDIGSTPTSRCSTMGIRVLSRPFLMDATFYMLVTGFITSTALGNFANSDPPVGADSYLIEVPTAMSDINPVPHRYVGHIEMLTSGMWGRGTHSNVAQVSSTEYAVVAPFISTALTGRQGWLQGTRLVTMTIGTSLPKDMWRSISIGEETYLNAGVLTAWDGRMPFDVGFAHPAYLNVATTLASGVGGFMNDGGYLYNVVPEYRSAAGILHRGPTGIPLLKIVVGPTVVGSVTVGIVPVHLSQKIPDTGLLHNREPLRVLWSIYRSVSGGTVLQRLTVEPTFNLVYQPEVGSNIFIDTRNDSAINGAFGGAQPLAARPPIYTEGGELDDFQPPAFLTMALYRNRIFGITGDRRTVWFSKDTTQNPGIQPGFHPSFRILVNDDLVALAVLDERLIMFSSTGIYTMAGDGPALNGDGDFGSVTKLQTDVGCTNARCVVSTDKGIVFEWNGELHLLNRSLEIVWIGRRIQDVLADFPNFTSAVMVSKHNQVRVSCLSSDGLTGRVVAYDYVEDQWSVFRYGADLPIADAVLHDNVYTFVTTLGIVYKEDVTTHLDNGEWVAAKVETAWQHSSGPLAYHSVRNFQIDGVSGSAHGLQISVAFNGDTAYDQGPRVWAEGVAGVTATGPIEAAKVSVGPRRKCRSIRFKIEDTEPVVLGTGQGPLWSSMGVEVGLKRGFGKLAERQTR